MDAGFQITVEEDPQRVFEDSEYEKVGCKMVKHNTWPSASQDEIIIGLKELPPNDSSALPHMHIMFAHCYKTQAGWIDVLNRWDKAQPTGMLYDLEFLQDERGRRVAAFGYHAGFAGAAVGALALAEQVKDKRLGKIEPYPNEKQLIEHVKTQLEQVKKSLGRPVKALVIGALGRCGRGAVDFFLAAGLNSEDVIKWDMAETAKGGPFDEILEVDIFVNCIYLSHKIPSFVSRDSIAAYKRDRQLRCVVDVSCDTTNPNNPIPIYDINTTFDKPTVDVEGITSGPTLTVVSIDHLPTLLPREASEAFSKDLLPSLLTLPQAIEERKKRGLGRSIKITEVGTGPERVWKEAEALFWDKLEESRVAAKV
ncbi:saccharopine dehydrogenase (NAD+, L-lysine forming) [Microbotryum lychnidis-dioicae p1A1 Lamole]|uniref:Saccharopine dehydrogenase [NAD(+), L-lysine-forming] n=1 Tax=Microbotryum lychnidis-dioicae (strain p1A1 Lamole / MvSl-1064) TaxID=683840 RepID=U5H3Q9_USTV1|nr:saccharopine dehydrogenase (NAD+, L-lysine forming) [Microbotryum lychnidis-dioicae p1A1 Lamole]|eukprot:KDE07876.1 saccharopine dehydrogenase (NAD+, L-lysine forming) [Microbotryum lychnidis-dioicae p1A1 Lamole]